MPLLAGQVSEMDVAAVSTLAVVGGLGREKGESDDGRRFRICDRESTEGDVLEDFPGELKQGGGAALCCGRAEGDAWPAC